MEWVDPYSPGGSGQQATSIETRHKASTRRENGRTYLGLFRTTFPLRGERRGRGLLAGLGRLWVIEKRTHQLFCAPSIYATRAKWRIHADGISGL